MFIKNEDVANINSCKFLPADVFICSSSFENRCLTIPDALENANIGQVFILRNTNVKEVMSNAEHLMTLFPGKGGFIDANTRDSISTADNIFKALVAVIRSPGTRSVIVDISTFTHESLLLLIHILSFLSHSNLEITLLYTSALEYSTDKNTIEEKWLSSGVAGIRTILGYSGDVNPLNKTHLIMFVGYESSRSSKIIELIEPSVISLGYGQAGTSTNVQHEQASAYFHTIVEDMAGKNAKVHSFPFSCSNPYHVKEAIIEQCSKVPNVNVVIAPMNTKLSTVGVGLAALEFPKIQLCYAPALQYNFNNYSKPSNTFSAFKLILNSPNIKNDRL